MKGIKGPASRPTVEVLPLGTALVTSKASPTSPVRFPESPRKPCLAPRNHKLPHPEPRRSANVISGAFSGSIQAVFTSW